MSDIIRLATLSDLSYINHLAGAESKSLGFIPKMAYESAITGEKTGKRWSKVCNDKLWVCENNGDLVGFVYATMGRATTGIKMGKIAQIAIQEDARRIQRGLLLLEEAKRYGFEKGTLRWQCGCAEDLESNIFWQAMGWVKVGERKGISHKNTWKQTSDRVVNLYRHDPSDLFLQAETITP